MSQSFENRFAHSGLNSSSEGLFNTLVDLLSNEYEPSSIWKELLQNAEDAGAQSLHFLTLPALSEGHIFERTPVLCALNDGAFSSVNAQAITEMGLGTKGANEDAIGKFGLGMKSVFNLGEVLFYFASPGQNASIEQQGEGTGAPFGKMLNPHDTVKGQSNPWNLGDGRTRNALMKRLLKRLEAHPAYQELQNGPNARWFALVLPLRSAEITQGVYPLKDLFPTPDSLFPSDLPARLNSFFPMLRALQNLSVWRLEDQTAPWFCAKLAQNGRRAHANSQLLEAPRTVFDFGGAVLAEKARLVFEGREIGFARDEFADTGIESGAQKQYVRGEDGAAAQRQKEKFTPCGAAVWFQTTQSERLAVRPAVWLPLPEERDTSNGKSDAFDLPIPGCDGLQLTLHGNFFIDKGRRNLVLNSHDRDGETAQSKWNKKLLREATLPLVLPALVAFLDKMPAKEKLDIWRIREITRALEKANFWIEKGEQRAALTQKGNWLYRLSGANNGAFVGAWELETDSKFWTLPAPPEGEAAGALKNPAAKVFEWLPRLEDLCRLKTLTWEWPRLCGSEAHGWDEASILALFKASDGKDWFQSEISARYLVALMRHLKADQWSDELWQMGLKIARQGLREFGFGARLKDPVVESWKEFWALVPRRFWVPFEIGTKNDREEKNPTRAREFLGKLLALELEKLPVPSDLCPPNGDANSQRWDAGDARRVARHFADLIANHATLGDWVRPNHLLEAMAGDLEEKFAAMGEFALFRTKEWRSDAEPTKKVPRSWRELRELRKQSRLWGDARDGGRDWLRDYGLAVDLSQKNRDGDESFIVSIEEGADRAYSRALWPRREEQPQSFCAAACLKLLLSRPILRGISGRAKLVPRLFDELKTSPTSQNTRALRYLLHGQAEKLSDEQPLFKSALGAGVWLKIAQVVMFTDDSWRLVDELLSLQISDDIAQLLSIELADKSLAQRLLSERANELGALSFDFSTQERREVLLGIEDEAIFRALPFHDLAHQNGVTCGVLPEIVFLQGEEIEVPDALQTEFDLLARFDDAQLEGGYKKWGIKPFALESLVERALCHRQPELFTATILETLAKLPPTFENQDLWAGLKSEKWLLVENIAYSSAQIVHLEAIAAESQEIARGWPEGCVCWADVEAAWAGFDGLKILRNHLPNASETAQILARALESNTSLRQKWALGDLTLRNSMEADFERFLRGWRGVLGKPQGVMLLEKLDKNAPEAAQILGRALLKSVPVESLEIWLVAVSKNLESHLTCDPKEPLVALHFWLFEAFCAHPDARRERWAEMVFPSQTGVWKKPQALAREGFNLDESCFLHPQWKAVLENSGKVLLLGSTGERERPQPSQDEWKTLESQLQIWEAAPQLKAAFLTMLGAPEDHHDARRLDSRARRLVTNLMTGSENDGRLMIWRSLCETANNAGYYAQTTRSKPIWFAWTKAQGASQVEALDLLGIRRSFDLHREGLRSLVRTLQTVSGGWHATLFELEEASDEAARLRNTQLVQETIRVLWRARVKEWSRVQSFSSDDQHQSQAHTQSQENQGLARMKEKLESLLATWSETEQFELQMAQDFMLQSAFFYFRTLSSGAGQITRNYERQFHDLRYQIAATSPSQIAIENGRSVSVLSRLQKQQNELIARLETDLGDPQSALCLETCGMVRAKIGDLGYDIASVPFELFQNSDDAAAELQNAQEADGHTGELEIQFCSRSKRVVWRHFGRKLNIKGGLGKLSGEEVARRGYGRDLEKMLILQASDKADAQSGGASTTGKWGLGFKSLYLVTNQPRVQSGELCFDVCGGFYPRKTKPFSPKDDAEKLEKARHRASTRFEFELRAETDANELWAHFWRVLPFQLLFSRAIKSCCFECDGDRFRLEPLRTLLLESVELVEWADIGNWPLGESQSHLEPLPTRGLRISTPKGTLLLALDDNGVCSWPRDVPCVWATTPTRVALRPGFVVNADWMVDVGRVQLAGGDKNAALAKDLGAVLGEVLAKISAWKTDWGHWSFQLGLDKNVTFEAFARSLAKVLAHPEARNHDVLGAVCHRTSGALAPFAGFAPRELVASELVTSEAPKLESQNPIAPLASLNEISEWWQSPNGRARIFGDTLEGPLFPDSLHGIYDELAKKNRRAWLALLLRSTLEGVGWTSDETKIKFLEWCCKNGWLDHFSRSEVRASDIGFQLEKFLFDDSADHKYLHLVRHCAPLFSLCQWLDEYMEVLSNIRPQARAKMNGMRVLAPRTDVNWGIQIDVPDAPSLRRTLGIGAHFLMRELWRADIMRHNGAVVLCYHPTESLRRALELHCPEIRADKSPQELARIAHDFVKTNFGDPTLGGDFCLPITCWAKHKAAK